jgi:hypothetical protein
MKSGALKIDAGQKSGAVEAVRAEGDVADVGRSEHPTYWAKLLVLRRRPARALCASPSAVAPIPHSGLGNSADGHVAFFTELRY